MTLREKCTAETKLRTLVYVRYLDHALFRDADLELQGPVEKETIGWLDHKEESHIRLVWERYMAPPSMKGHSPRGTGLIILRADILELKALGADGQLTLTTIDLEEAAFT